MVHHVRVTLERETFIEFLEVFEILIRFRELAITELIKIADHIHTVQCNGHISNIVGASVAVVGGLTVIVSASATVLTAGFATPLFVASISGTVASLTGAGVGIGAGVVCSNMTESDFKKAKDFLQRDLVNSKRVRDLAEQLQGYFDQHDFNIEIDARRIGVGLAASAGAGAGSIAAAFVSKSAAEGVKAAAAAVGQGTAKGASTLVRVGAVLGVVGILAAIPATGLEVYKLVKSAKSLHDDLPSDTELKIRDAAQAMEDILVGTRESHRALLACNHDQIIAHPNVFQVI